MAISEAASDARVCWYHMQIEQNPEAPGFWERWRGIYKSFSFMPGDYIVASEPYGQRLADELGGVFMPYDLERTVTTCKATEIRNDPISYWKNILPEFRRDFVQRVTVFGAESCGKTTLAKNLAWQYNAPWLFEWARPYLENVGPEITNEKMRRIWLGQSALQKSADFLDSSPVIFQDTDLFSTVGYWQHWDAPNMPWELQADAVQQTSDLYLVVKSNIPFEADPLRYGGDQRELDDQYWIDLCKLWKLNYRVIDSSGLVSRIAEASSYINGFLRDKIDFNYDRKFND
jgi:NadR type nicotinamide-nucleotide adenylyltransferase